MVTTKITPTPHPLKAVILAAGAKSITDDGLPVLLQDLGGRKIIDYVTANVAQVVAPADTYVVVGYRGEAIQAHLGPGYRYVVQEEATGHRRRRAAAPAAAGGLRRRPADPLRRHAALLAGLDPRADQPPPAARGPPDPAHRGRRPALPYGRIIRDSDGRIMDIIEEAEASARVREIRELNVGAYVVSAPADLAGAGGAAALAAGRRVPADRLVHRLIRSGCPWRATRSTTRTRSRASTRARTWSRPSSSCKSASSGRGGRRSATSSPSAPAAGARSSARASRCTTCAGCARRWPTRSPAAGWRSGAC